MYRGEKRVLPDADYRTAHGTDKEESKSYIDKKKMKKIASKCGRNFKVFGPAILSVILWFALTIIVAYIMHNFFLDQEIASFQGHVSSTADLLQRIIIKDTFNAQSAAKELALIFRNHAPDELWPNVTYKGFEEIASIRLSALNYRAISIWPLVNTSTRPGFEKWALDQVRTGQVDGADQFSKNPWNITNGIFDRVNGTRFKANGKNNSPKFPDIYTPIWQAAPIDANRVAVMFNGMCDPYRRAAIEKVIEFAAPSVTDIIQLLTDVKFRPTTQIFSPIPARSNSSKVHGIVAYSFSWDTFFTDVLSDHIKGVSIVLSTRSTIATYIISGREVQIFKGDVHDKEFDAFKRTLDLTDVINVEGYSMVAYPTDAMYESFLTDNPRNAAIIIATVCFSLFLFAVCVYVMIRNNKREHELQVRSDAEAQFTDFLAHEVRNPLSGIDSCTALILDELELVRSKVEGKFGPDIVDQPIEDSKHIRKCVKYIQSILNNTLDMSKLKDGRLDISLCTVFVRTEIVDMVMTMLTSMKSERVIVEVDCDSNIFVNADVLRLTQVVTNLLTNAFKFCKEGRVGVVVKFDEATSTVSIAIEDTGPGIPPEHRSKLFSKYGQIAVRQGTGLGLVLALEMCKALGGRLYLCDKYDKGSRFVIELSGGLAEPPELAAATSSMVEEETEILPPNLNVLLVDDSIAASKLLQRRFQINSKEVKITTAINGEEALILLEDDSVVGFDVVVIDENMQSTGGVLLGHEVVAIMRKKLKLDRTVIFGCTGNSLTCGDDFLACGADDVWSKPTPETPAMASAIYSVRKKILKKAIGLPCSVSVAVVDDSSTNSKVLIRRISKCLPVSWSFKIFSSISEFENRVTEPGLLHSFDVVILDQNFEGETTTGSELVYNLRKVGHYTGLIVGCSGDDSFHSIFMAKGANLFWTKPPPLNEQIVLDLLTAFKLKSRKTCS